VGDVQERARGRTHHCRHQPDLDTEVREGRFRRDLFERLNFGADSRATLRGAHRGYSACSTARARPDGVGRWISLSPETEHFLSTLDFTWPGNVRHIEQLAARLTLEGGEPVSSDRLESLLDRGGTVDEAATTGSKHRAAGIARGGGKTRLQQPLRARYPNATRRRAGGDPQDR
jgi:transcriptional regulator with GAF, ATPase, and Fis domain